MPNHQLQITCVSMFGAKTMATFRVPILLSFSSLATSAMRLTAQSRRAALGGVSLAAQRRAQSSSVWHRATSSGGRSSSRPPAGELPEPGLDEARQAVHVDAVGHHAGGVELVPGALLLAGLGGDPEDALRGEAALVVQAALQVEQDGGDAVPPAVVRALHRLRRHAEHRLAGAGGQLHLRPQLLRHAAEPVEPVERHVRHVPDVRRPPDLHRRRRLPPVVDKVPVVVVATTMHLARSDWIGSDVDATAGVRAAGPQQMQ